MTDETHVKRTRRVPHEAILQRHVKLFCRDAITAQHKFLAFDRSAPRGKFSHLAEKARGVEANTPDTLLMVVDLRDIWTEWKWPPNKPNAGQIAMGQNLMDLGRWWSWADNIQVWAEWLFSLGVEMRADFRSIAERHQAAAESTIARAELKRGTVPKSAKSRAEPRYTAGKGALKRWAKVGLMP